jgi:hypothetical protein
VSEFSAFSLKESNPALIPGLSPSHLLAKRLLAYGDFGWVISG